MPGDDAMPNITPRLIWKIYSMPIIFGIVSLFFIAISITIFIKSYQPTTPITFSSEEEDASVSGVQTIDSTILVDIEGAVVKPGVYKLQFGSRVDEAVTAAGGFTKEADLSAISRSINRAAKLADGAKLYIPRIGEVQDEAGESASLSTILIGVNINTASQAELEALMGVGPVTAGKIMNGRPYTRLEELVEKQVMSQSLFEKLKDQLTL